MYVLLFYTQPSMNVYPARVYMTLLPIIIIATPVLVMLATLG